VKRGGEGGKVSREERGKEESRAEGEISTTLYLYLTLNS
jgi:hypothetical protein